MTAAWHPPPRISRPRDQPPRRQPPPGRPLPSSRKMPGARSRRSWPSPTSRSSRPDGSGHRHDAGLDQPAALDVEHAQRAVRLTAPVGRRSGIEDAQAVRAASSGMCEWPKTTSAADGNAARIRRSRPAAGRCRGSSRPAGRRARSRGSLAHPTPRHRGRRCCRAPHAPARTAASSSSTRGGADVAGVQDRVRAAQPASDRRRAVLPAPRRVGIGQHDDAHRSHAARLARPPVRHARCRVTVTSD